MKMETLASRCAVFWTVALLGFTADLVTKARMFAWLGLPGEQPPVWCLENVVGFQTALNFGAAFGLGQGWGWLFGATSILALLIIQVWLFGYGRAKSWFWTLVLAVVTAGVLGNLYDRLGLYGLTLPGTDAPCHAVRDWILVMIGTYHWPNFNLADSFLVAGALLILLASFFARDVESSPEI